MAVSLIQALTVHRPRTLFPYVSLIHSGAEGDKKSLVIFSTKTKSPGNTRQLIESRSIAAGLFCRAAMG
jgi:hypothetical protein